MLEAPAGGARGSPLRPAGISKRRTERRGLFRGAGACLQPAARTSQGSRRLEGIKRKSQSGMGRILCPLVEERRAEGPDGGRGRIPLCPLYWVSRAYTNACLSVDPLLLHPEFPRRPSRHAYFTYAALCLKCTHVRLLQYIMHGLVHALKYKGGGHYISAASIDMCQALYKTEARSSFSTRLETARVLARSR